MNPTKVIRPTTEEAVEHVSMREIFWYFLKLGWLAFGGPVGQIGLMHLQVTRSFSLRQSAFIGVGILISCSPVRVSTMTG